jgi:ribosomal protein L31
MLTYRYLSTNSVKGKPDEISNLEGYVDLFSGNHDFFTGNQVLKRVKRIAKLQQNHYYKSLSDLKIRRKWMVYNNKYQNENKY